MTINRDRKPISLEKVILQPTQKISEKDFLILFGGTERNGNYFYLIIKSPMGDGDRILLDANFPPFRDLNICKESEKNMIGFQEERLWCTDV